MQRPDGSDPFCTPYLADLVVDQRGDNSNSLKRFNGVSLFARSEFPASS